MNELDAITRFTTTLLLPLYEEIRAAPRLAAKGRTITIAPGPGSGDEVTDEALAIVHADRRPVDELAAAGVRRGEYFGATLVIEEPAELRAPYSHAQAGRYYSSALFRMPGDGRVFVSPWVFYWMRFNDRMHSFAHRYDNDVADQPIETVTRAQMVNHALNSLTGFDIYAFTPTRPF